jgi:hypothetical protein
LAQEFTIKSETLEDKINQLLPTQGGYGAGLDLSASSMIIPIVDLTESAEGSNLREDLQTAIDLNVTSFDVNNATNTTIVNTTGYYRIRAYISTVATGSGGTLNFNITDGTTTKVIYNGNQSVELSAVGSFTANMVDFVVKLSAGHSLRSTANSAELRISGTAKQIADIDGNLT